MSAHTPGPWNVGWTFAEENEEVRYGINADTGTISDAEARANCALIAQAPAMAECLRNLRKQLQEHVKMDVRKHFSLMVADAAAGTILHAIYGPPTYAARVAALESEGLCTSDAQAAADAEGLQP